MSDAGRRSALVVVAREAGPLVREWRQRYDREAVERGIPPHLTILFPFVPGPAIDERTLSTLRHLYAAVRGFSYELAAVESFPDAAWLAPTPVEPFLALVDTTRRAFPTLPPYGDPAHVVVPHCTIGTDADPGRVDAMVSELRANLGPRLPIRCRATEMALVGELPSGRWVQREAFPFEGRP